MSRVDDGVMMLMVKVFVAVNRTLGISRHVEVLRVVGHGDDSFLAKRSLIGIASADYNIP
jgi:hypothetical protein